MTHIFICRHGAKSDAGLLLSEGWDQLKVLGNLVRPYIVPVQTGGPWIPPRSSVYFTSTKIWAFQSAVGVHFGGGSIVANHLFYADTEMEPQDLERAARLIDEQLASNEVIVVVTHAVITGELPHYLAKTHLGMDDVHASKSWLSYAEAVHIDTTEKRWAYINMDKR